MEKTEKSAKNTHHGHAIKRFRSTLRIKQEALAADMGISQALVSFYEQQKEIDDATIYKFAKALNVAPELIKDLEEDPVTVIIENNTIDNKGNLVNISSPNYYNPDPTDQLLKLENEKTDLYERMLKLERERVVLLEKLLKERK
ncbi:helix-turn-helix domain-containing protein [Dysgonomonas sp.]|jgi:Helix-turn-helix.